MTHETTRQSLSILRPPITEIDREAEAEEKERSATWLQLMFDIFYVACLRMLPVSKREDAADIVHFIMTFWALWWSWMMVTLYDTKYDTDDVFHRMLKFVQIVSVGMSMFVAEISCTVHRLAPMSTSFKAAWHSPRKARFGSPAPLISSLSVSF